MPDNDPRATAQLADPHRRALDALDPVVQKIDLAAARDLAGDRVPDDPLVVSADNRFHGLAVWRGRFDQRHVPRPHQRKVEGPWNRRRGERQHIDEAEFFLEGVLVFHAEPLLLVHHDKAEVFERDVRGDDPVGADHDIHAAIGEPRDDFFLLRDGTVAAQELDRHRILAHPLPERLEMLLREHGRRRNDDSLLSAAHRLERRADCDLGLAESDIAADQPVHRAHRLHVGLGLGDRPELVAGLGEKKRSLEFLLPVRVGRERVPDPVFPFGLDLEHAGRVFVNPLRGLRFRPLPSPVSELREIRMALPEPDIPRNLPCLIERDIKPGVARELQREHLAAAVRGLLQAEKPADPVVEVDDEIVFLKLRKIHRRPPGPHPVAPQRRPVRALARRAPEDLGVGQQRKLRLGADEPARRGNRQKLQPRGIEIKIRRQLPEPLALTLVVAGERDLPPLRRPLAELVEKPAALDFIEDQVAGPELCKRNRVKRNRCGQVEK